jgi:23S rRNA pseudouridine1911/1915/1917 synthase
VIATPRALRVGDEDTGQRLDVFLAGKLDLSRAQARRLLARGAVRVDGRPVAAGAKGERLWRGAAVSVAPFTRPEHQRALAEPAAPLVVLARGPGWLVVDKPAGIPVHPLAETERGTVLNALVARAPELHGVGEGGLRSGVVHRLDVETSGALLFATEPRSWGRLRAAFREHRVEKVYRAVVVGRLEHPGHVELGLVTARHRPARVRVVAEGERARSLRVGVTSWRPLEVWEVATLVEVRPKTGFLHQIRATFAHLGFPIVGDRIYATAGDASGAPRQMLHAARLEFEEVAAASPDPADFAALCARLRGERSG